MPSQAPAGTTSPATEASSLMSPTMMDPVTYCPQPRRAFPPLTAGPSTPDKDNAGISSAYENEAARNELCELLSSGGDGCAHGKSALPLDGDHRPLSSISTSAGATPSPDSRASPHPWPPTPDSQRNVVSPEIGCGGGTGNASGNGGNRRRGSGAGSGFKTGSVASPAEGQGARFAGGPPPQAGKVFVGGVPQDMNQGDLFTIFNEWGDVRKAWLQSYRTAGKGAQSPPHNHRGFGFVVFADGSAVDRILGSSFSRFLSLQDGRKLEVKRAVPSGDLPGKPSGHTAHAQRSAGPTDGLGGYHRGPTGPLFSQAAKAPPAPPAGSRVVPQPAVPQAAYQAAQPAPQAAHAFAGEGWQWATQFHGAAAAPAMQYAAGTVAFAAPPPAPWPTFAAPAHAVAMPSCVPNATHAMHPAQPMMMAPVQWQGGYASFGQPMVCGAAQQQPAGMPAGHHAFGQQAAPQQQLLQFVQPHGPPQQQPMGQGYSFPPDMQMVAANHAAAQQNYIFHQQ